MLERFFILLKQMKPLRIVLSIAAILFCIFATPANTQAQYEGFQVITTLVLPALTPLLFLVLLLDALMNRVWRIDAVGSDVNRYRNIMRVDLLLSLLILIFWAPYFIAIWN